MASCLIFIIFMLPYFCGYWWKFLPTTVAILTLIKFSGGQYDYSKLGLRLSYRQFKLLIWVLFSSYLSFKWLIDFRCRSLGINYTPAMPLWKIGISCQVFNEEVVLRGLLLYRLTQLGLSRQLISISCAIIFALLHGIFYYVSQQQLLYPSTLLFLGLFGYLANLLYYQLNTLWFGFALHLAWNLHKFSGDFFWHGNKLSEPSSFNLIDGWWVNLVFLVGLILLCFRYRHKLTY